MIDRIAEIVSDIAENGITGAAGLSLILGTILAILVFSIILVQDKNGKGD